MAYTIEVTQADIDAANAHRQKVLKQTGYATHGVTLGFCPIAIALKRQIGNGVLVSAEPDQITVRSADGRVEQYLRGTKTILQFMKRWDKRFKAVPTRFRVTEDRSPGPCI